MTITELLIATLAVWELLEIWRHGEILAGVRAKLEAWDHWFFSQLAACMFCLAPWVATLIVVPIVLVPLHMLWSWYWLLSWPLGLAACTMRAIVYGMAVARLANLANDYFHKKCRSPGDVDVEEEEEEEGESSLAQMKEEPRDKSDRVPSAWEVVD